MNRSSLYEADDEDADDEEDDINNEDLEGVRRACIVSNANSDEFTAKPDTIEANKGGGGGLPSDSDNEDDLEMLRSVQNQLAFTTNADLSTRQLPSDSESDDDFAMIRSIKSLLALPMDVSVPPMGFSDDDEDGAYETLQAIRRRFSSYSNLDAEENFMNNSPGKIKQVHASDNDPSSEILSRSNTCESFPDHGKSFITVPDTEDACQLSLIPAASSSFPEAAKAFIDAIRRNRAYQKLLRRKLTEIEATIEQNEKHQKNVKIVKDLQAACKRITKQALSQRKDPRVELISTRKSGPCDISEGNDKKVSPLTLGPPENSCVANYRIALGKYPISMDCRNWSTEENESLAKGLKQEVQKILLSEAIERFSDVEGSSYDIDTINESVGNLEITPEIIRQFLPQINWDLMDIKDRSAAECEARWVSSEDPSINHCPWTASEEKNLLQIIESKGLTDWIDIAVSLGTNRTPFQCLVRYQRSLNASILRKEWTAEEDDQLCAAVKLLGSKDWQSVANELEGRTGPQCSNRWKKSLCPTRKGKWNSEEDKRVKVAVTLFGAKNWHKIAQFVPGRTATQCRERWVNSLDPKINYGKWTEEEDAKLTEAVEKYGDSSWSKVASHISCRTDNQCSRRWNSLYPHRRACKQEARRLQKEAIVGNFVDRESERPALVAADFMALPDISLEPERGTVALKKKRKAKQKKSEEKRQPKRRRKGSERCSGDVGRLEDETVNENERNNGGEERLLKFGCYGDMQDIVKDKQSWRRESVVEESNNTTRIKKLEPRRKVSAVVPIANQDEPT